MTGKHNAQDAAIAIIRRLRAEGHVALLAGGCVRDRLLDRPPKDYDVATDATPPRLRAIFPRAKQVGAKFGVMLVRRYGYEIEVATFRSDGDYSDGRRPDEVTFGTDLEDARRRDFTINGLFFDPIADRLIDHVGGRADLAARVLRTIGDPRRRFDEDHLRMLRAVRFCARLGFTLDQATGEAIGALAPKLAVISPERIWMELEMILTDPSRATGWDLLTKTGLRPHLSAAWSVVTDLEALIPPRLAALSGKAISPACALASLLLGRSRDDAVAVCRALRLSNRLSRAVVWLVAAVPEVAAAGDEPMPLADLKGLMAGPAWSDLLRLLSADLTARGVDRCAFDRLRCRAETIPPHRVTPPPLLTGDDLSALGVSPGPRMGRLLDAVYRAQLNEQINDRDEAVAFLKELIK